MVHSRGEGGGLPLGVAVVLAENRAPVQGELRCPLPVGHLEAQAEQAWGLALVTNAVVTWTTEYYGLAVESMRRSVRRIDDTLFREPDRRDSCA